MDDKESLVNQVKSIQRTDEQSKQMWWSFCDSTFGGVRDPNRHDESSLQQFLASYHSGTLAPAPQTGNGKLATGDKEGLVNQVKQIQRKDEQSKQLWWNFCDSSCGGVRDPNRHDESTLQQFLMTYNGGAMRASMPQVCAPKGKGKGPMGLAMGGMMNAAMMAPMMAMPMGGGGNQLVELIKAGQKQSPSWKNAWHSYCTSYGTGKFDPNHYDSAFITSFIEYVGAQALASLGMPPESGGGGVKRGPFEGMALPAAKRMAMGGGIGDDPQKAELVARVKEYQRSGQEAKEAWGTYCDSMLGGVRDPNRHDTEQLQMFLAECGISV